MSAVSIFTFYGCFISAGFLLTVRVIIATYLFSIFIFLWIPNTAFS